MKMDKEQALKSEALLAAVEGTVEALEGEILKIVAEIRPPKTDDTNDASIASFYSAVGVVGTTKIAKRVYDLKDRLSTLKTLFENLNDMFAKNVLPELIAEEELQSPVKVAGVAKLVLRNELYVQNVAAEEQKFFDWLIGIGQSDLIKETVNASSLKSSVKAVMKKNNELLALEENRGRELSEIEGYTPIPEDILKVTPYQMVAFNKL